MGGLPCGCCLLRRGWPFQLPVALQDSDKTSWNVTRRPCGGQNSQAGDTAAGWAHWRSARSHHLIDTFCAVQLQKEDCKWVNGYAMLWTVSWGYECWDPAVKTGTIERPEKINVNAEKWEQARDITAPRNGMKVFWGLCCKMSSSTLIIFREFNQSWRARWGI